MASRRTHVQGVALTLAALLAFTGCGLLGGDGDGGGDGAHGSGDAAPTASAAATGSADPSEGASEAPSSSATAPPTLDDSLAEARQGVVRIEVTTCDGGYGGGTGFLVGDNLVVTAAHVVDEVYSLSLRTPSNVTRAEVVGIDTDEDVALLRVVHPFKEGRHLTFAADQPRVEQEVGTLGYPLLHPLTSTRGRVQDTDSRVELEDRSAEGLLRLQMKADGGNSGGPVLDAAGDVVGVLVMGSTYVTQGIIYAVPAATAAPLVDAWTASPDVTATEDCAQPWADLVTIESRHPDAPTIAATLHRYFTSINEDKEWGPESAWAILSGDMRGAFDNDFDRFTEELSTTEDADVVLEVADMVDETTNTADVRFRSWQDEAYGHQGQTCTDWHVRYTLEMGTADSSPWVITGARQLSTPTSCEGDVLG